jgi:6-pyruvoyltetrahydropterin/6-carboxytetrahydropterin synthase
MKPATVMRKIEFDAAHRVLNHESKCANLHGHRYVVEIHARAPALDSIGRVIDFSCLKREIGGWIDEHWDHTTILNGKDAELLDALECVKKNKPIYGMNENPTAENMASHLLKEVCPNLMGRHGVEVFKIVVWETPNCFAEAEL